MAVDEVPTVHILAGGIDASRGTPWYSPSEYNFTGPARIRIVNDDESWHRIMGIPGDDKIPDWVTLAAPGSHSHGTTGLAFDVSLEGGESADVDISRDGPIRIHCHPHPWMTGLWNVQVNGTHDYAVAVNTLSLTGAADGTLTTAAPSREFQLSLPSPNLRSLRANLTWDDSGDDGEVGPDGNQPDTLQVSLIDATGQVVANSNQTSRNGNLTLEFTTPMTPWPDKITADGFDNAQAAMASQHPESTAWSGTWKIVIMLIAAPGPIPDSSGTLNAVAVTDGQQAFSLDFDAIHEWGAVAAVAPIQIHGTIEAT